MEWFFTLQKKEDPKPVYGKKVEHLKSVIKSCGMRSSFLWSLNCLMLCSGLSKADAFFCVLCSVPPSVYKRVKQAPEDKREACLIKELEEILAKEGLSTSPSEKGAYGQNYTLS